MLTPFCDGRGLGSSNVARHAKTKNGPTPKAMAMCMCSNSNPWHGSSQAWLPKLPETKLEQTKPNSLTTNACVWFAKATNHRLFATKSLKALIAEQIFRWLMTTPFLQLHQQQSLREGDGIFVRTRYGWHVTHVYNQQKYWTSKPPSQVSLAQVKGGPFLPGLMIKSIPLGCWDWFQVQLLTANYEWWLVRQQICRHNVFQTGVWLGIVEVEAESKLVRDPISSALAAMTFEYQEVADPAFSWYGLNKFSLLAPNTCSSCSVERHADGTNGLTNQISINYQLSHKQTERQTNRPIINRQ